MIQLNDRWRVIESDDAAPYRQWLLQRSITEKGEVRWKSLSFCQTRQALLTAINEKIVNADRFYAGGVRMEVDPAALGMVRNLPLKVAQSAV